MATSDSGAKKEGLLPGELVVLGSGTALPTAQRGSPGYLLRFADGRGILLDAGPGSVRAAARHGVSVERLTGALVTHFHPDHTLDLFALIFGHRSPFVARTRLHLIGPAGLIDLHQRMRSVYGGWMDLPDGRLTVHEIGAGSFDLNLDGLRLRGDAVSMPHLAHSLGYRLEGAHRQWLAYSGDTGIGPGPVKLGRAVDHYLLEAAFPDGDGDGHLTPRLAGSVAREARCGWLYVTHLYPETERLDIAAEVRKEYSGPLTIATDGLEIEF
jgi:ribonuclease BN (tRNA processing enzyme)